ncbi:MAG: hypothetical protein JWR85_2882 [Marmoricola sp.]|nr:hypothetical protein [Marmoricola sp.]
MPSLHAGWAWWVALVVNRLAGGVWRVLAWTHVAVTAVVVVGTGNHWVLDVAMGWLVVVLGFFVVRVAARRTGAGPEASSRPQADPSPGCPPAAQLVLDRPTDEHNGVDMSRPVAPEPAKPDPSTFVARTPTDLIAVVPAVLGFHPQDSVVLLTFGPPGGAFHARVDLPVEPSEQEDVAAVLVDAVIANRVARAAVLLYTDDVEVAHAQARLLVGRLLDLDVDVIEVLRIDDGHWHSLPENGSPGTAYDLDTHPFTAQRVFEGQVVHRDRDELADSLVGTDEEDAVEVALAAARFADLMATSEEAREPAHGFLRTEARWLQRRIRARLVDRRHLEPSDAGRMLVLASLVPTRDVAWAEITRETSGPHVDLWRDLVRRSPRDLLPGASSLLAFAAWQHGDGALAWCAIDRCLEVDPDYSMAHCVAEVLTRAVPPTVWEQIPEDELPVFNGLVPDQGRGDRAS